MEASNLRKEARHTTQCVGKAYSRTVQLSQRLHLCRDQSERQSLFSVCRCSQVSRALLGAASIFYKTYAETAFPMFLTAFLSYAGFKHEPNSDYIQSMSSRLITKFLSLGIFNKTGPFFLPQIRSLTAPTHRYVVGLPHNFTLVIPKPHLDSSQSPYFINILDD